MTTEEKKAELEAAGYNIDKVMHNGLRYYCLSTPKTEWISYFDFSDEGLSRTVNAGYAHLQEKKRLAALERKSLLLEAEVLILRHLVSGYVTMPPEVFFRAVAVWHFNMIKHHDKFTGDATKGREWLNGLPETIAFYKRIQGEE